MGRGGSRAAPPWHVLSDEVWEHAFSFLPTESDRGAAAAACRSWLRAERRSRRLLSAANSYAASPQDAVDRFPAVRVVEKKRLSALTEFAIDKMQSACLDEYEGEKAVDLSTQETTIIQHIFGGRLQSQVQCTACGMVSDRYDNMMDLTVEIQGDAEPLEKCLDQYTAIEWLDGDNKYKCDGCNDYVKARKHLSVHQAPNILTITLKRFQSGRFGKLNKRVTFPMELDLTPYMSCTDGSDLYDLYAVVVHLDMLNASFFGHYICYIKGYQGRWYKIDDCKVMVVDKDEVRAQGAYMLLYSRRTARPRPLVTVDEAVKQQQQCKLLPSNEQNHMILADATLNCESSLKTSSDIPGAAFVDGIDSGNPACCHLVQDVYGPWQNKIQHSIDAISGLHNLKRLRSYGSTVYSAGIRKRQCLPSVTTPPDYHEVSLIRYATLTQKPTWFEERLDNNILPVQSSLSGLSREINKQHSLAGGNNTIGHDYEQVKQIFVNLGGASLSMQVNMATTTVTKLVGLALWRRGIRYNDMYLLYSGKILDDAFDLSLLHIPNNASFAIVPRLRAGRDNLLINYRTFEDFVKDIKPFYKVIIPNVLRHSMALGDLFIVFLSQSARFLVHMMIICLSRLHAQGDSLAGKFEYTDFVFWNDCAMIRPEVKRDRASKVNIILDFRRLSKMIDKLFRRPGLQPPHPDPVVAYSSDDDLPAYLGDLIRLLRVFVHQGDNSALRAYTSNHPCLLCFRERIKKIIEMDIFYNFLDHQVKQIFKTAIGDFGNWAINIVNVQPIYDAYMYGHINGVSRFGTHGVDWVEVSRNFLSHPDEKTSDAWESSLAVACVLPLLSLVLV